MTTVDDNKNSNFCCPENWVKSSHPLKLTTLQKEWDIAKKVAKKYQFFDGVYINRKHYPGLNHSFLYCNQKLYAIGRLKPFMLNNQEVKEGYLNYGSFSVIRILEDENNKIYLAKQSDNDKSRSDMLNKEIESLTRMNEFLGIAYKPKSKSARPWIHNQTIKSKNFMIINYYKGVQLTDYSIRNSQCEAISDENVLLIAKSLSKKLEEIHKNNIIHNDLNPNNILVQIKEKELDCNIIDFGLSDPLERFETSIETNYFKGTPAYMAKESKEFSENLAFKYSYKSDIYALGKIFTVDLCLYDIANKFNQSSVSLLENMCDDDETNRPQISEILQYIEKLLDLHWKHKILLSSQEFIDNHQNKKIMQRHNTLKKIIANEDASNKKIDEILLSVIKEHKGILPFKNKYDAEYRLMILENLPDKHQSTILPHIKQNENKNKKKYLGIF